jgi:anthranilate 1,2-dioxygenase small subunit
MSIDPAMVRMALLALQDAYIDALDNDRLEAWPDFFIDDCLYEIVPKENEDLALPAPIMHCDNKAMLRDRVISLRHANIFAPHTYRHFHSGLVWRREPDGAISARSNYLVINSSQHGDSAVYQAGVYLDRVVDEEGVLRFASKRVICDTTRVQTLLAIPI